MKRKLIVILHLLFCYLNISAQEFIFHVKDESGKGLSYVNVFVNDTYGIQSDSLGKLKFFNYEKPHKLRFEKVGFQTQEIIHSEALRNKEVILKKIPFTASTLHNSNTEKVLGFTKKDKLKDEKIHQLSSNYEGGISFRAKEEYVGKRLSKIRFNAHQIGDSKLPLRINVYDLDENDLPRKNLLKQEIIIYPTEEKHWFEIDILNQNITFPETGVAVTVEILNPYVKRFKVTDKARPVILNYESTENKFIFRNTNWAVWTSLLGKTYAIQLIIN